MTVPPVGTAEPRRRLHPLSPLLRGGRLAVLVIVGISWQGYQNLGTDRWLMAVVAVAVLVLVYSVASWLATGFHVVGRELRIYEGLLSRRTRTIPLERLQSVELVRPVLARAFGLAELRLEVVGASKTEAPLAFLSVEEATDLRQRLLAYGAAVAPSLSGASSLSGSSSLSEASAAAPVVEHTIHTVANRDLLISQLLRPHWWFLPLAIAMPIVFLATGSDVSAIAFASTATAVLGAIQAPVRALLGDWRFTIGTAPDGLRLHRGLLETRSQTVPAGRLQSLVVEWPLLWRGLGWVRVQLHIAGVSSGSSGGPQGGSQRAGLLPVGKVPIAEQIIGSALPGFHLTSVAVHPVPARVRVLAPLRRRVLGYQLTPLAFVCRDGVLTRTLVVVPYDRMQSVRVRQGPLQRLLRVASVWVDTAGGGPTAVALHRDITEARGLALELSERSRAARKRPPVPLVPIPQPRPPLDPPTFRDPDPDPPSAPIMN